MNNGARTGAADFGGDRFGRFQTGEHTDAERALSAKSVDEANRITIDLGPLPYEDLDAIAAGRQPKPLHAVVRLMDAVHNASPVLTHLAVLAARQNDLAKRNASAAVANVRAAGDQLRSMSRTIKRRVGDPNWQSVAGMIFSLWLAALILFGTIELYSLANLAKSTGLSFVRSWPQAFATSAIFVAGAFVMTRKRFKAAERAGGDWLVELIQRWSAPFAWISLLLFAFSMGSALATTGMTPAQLPIPQRILAVMSCIVLVLFVVEAELEVERAFRRLFRVETVVNAERRFVERVHRAAAGELTVSRNKLIADKALARRIKGVRTVRTEAALNYVRRVLLKAADEAERRKLEAEFEEIKRKLKRHSK